MYQKNYIGREGQSNSLSHYKYISRKKVNGKWQYKYENPDEYDRNATVSKNVTTTYRNSNKLLDSTTKLEFPSTENGTSEETVIKERGKISQSIDKGKDWINKKLYGYQIEDEDDRNTTVSKNVTTTYKNGNKLLDSTTKINIHSPGDGTSKETVIKERGKISQTVNKGQAYLNAFLRDLGKKR